MGRPAIRDDMTKFADRVFVDEGLAKALERHVEEEGKTKAAVMRIALKEYADKRDVS